MRDDVLVDVVHQRCEALMRSGFWPGQSRVNPEAWMSNFEPSDKKIAALLLDCFVFCNDDTTNNLLKSAWGSIGDGLSKSQIHTDPGLLFGALRNSVFTPVEGEEPNPTDSGNFMCRKARQVLGVPDDRVMRPEEALGNARNGATVVFLDDFVGSGLPPKLVPLFG